MRIIKLLLKNFKNYDNIELDFNKNLNIIIGNNGQGKTNLLESIYVLAVTKSFLSINEKDLIKFNCSFSSIKGFVENKNCCSEYDVIFNHSKKMVRIDKSEIKKISEYISFIKVVYFNCDCIRVFKDFPSARRRYFNIQLSQLYQEYVKCLLNYNKILKARNEFLKILNINKQTDMDYLDILNNNYIDISLKIFKYRNDYISNINNYISNYFYQITYLDNLKLKYVFNFPLVKDEFKIELNKILLKEIKYKSTLLGPNRDDFIFLYDNKNLSIFGSRGQIRSAVMSLKFAEIDIIKNKCGEYPIFLIDDIFSELDYDKRNNIFNLIKKDMQVFMSTTDLESISKDLVKNATIYKIKNGKLFPGK